MPVEMEVLVEGLEAGAAGGGEDFEMHEVEEQLVPPPASDVTGTFTRKTSQ